MNVADIEHLLCVLPKLKFLVIGDLILDKYIWGAAERISPEAPIPIVKVDREETRLGGAGNVVNNLISLGCHVQIASVVGSDEAGTELKQLLQRQGVATAGIQRDSKRTTTCKTRIIAGHQQLVRLDHEDCILVDSFQEDQLLEFVDKVLGDVDVVLVSDYLKGVLSDRTLGEIIRISKKHSRPVVVDPKGKDFSRYKGVTLLTPNQREAEWATGGEILNHDSLLVIGESLYHDLELGALLITRGSRGMSLFTEDQPTHLATEAREVYDVSGAGDTVLSLCAVGLAGGLPLTDSAELANLAAGIVVGKVGTATVSPAELLTAALAKDQDLGRKILSKDRLAMVLEGYHQAGKEIIFTNGCFDLLHAGHVQYLQKARKLGDLLVLGLNSDESIRRLKGEKRPLLHQTERAQILAALDCVDYITIFEEDTPLELIRLIKPAVLAKGGDYVADEVVGREFVTSYGGRLVLLQFEDGKSTTNIIDEVLTRYRE
ncbi:MAG: bifunctional heptose 7-phosphate kinase/heptose 1-phosphate adenyltransferase [Candidatus Zixiibacteriota bacterium]|nr:MAG: bifunctional heptose 7-phosphate kinase/heptose 1-phosphate adenyltransferase [candidate division Zixibacteria bacterium]